MGNTLSSNEVGDAGRNLGRAPGVTAATQRRHAPRTLPPGGAPASPSDFPFITECLARLLIFNHLDSAQQHAIVQAMYERPVAAGEILIQEGDTGLAASELYVVKTGEFEVLQRRKGVNLRVNMKRRGDTFGEVSLMYNCPRSATVAATQDAVVWVLERDVFRQHVRRGQEDAASQLELFLNQVPILAPLSKTEKLRLLDAFEEKTFPAGATVVQEGEPGDLFYIIKDGEAVVLQSTAEPRTSRTSTPRQQRQQTSDIVGKTDVNADVTRVGVAVPGGESMQAGSELSHDADDISQTAAPRTGFPRATSAAPEQVSRKNEIRMRRVNQLFKSDFFGEAALLNSAPRTASVVAVTRLVCLTLDRENFIQLLGPLERLMAREKSPHVVGARLMKLASRGGPSRQQAMVHIKRKRYSKSQAQWVWELVRAVGHLDEVLELKTTEQQQVSTTKNGGYTRVVHGHGTDMSEHHRPHRDQVGHVDGDAARGMLGAHGPAGSLQPERVVDDPTVAEPVLHLVEGVVLGSGAFSRVSVVTVEGSERAYALKRLRKTAVAQCPEHVFCEQAITRNLTHPFCIRQYGSFQDKYHLYFLFDLMPGGDLMDVLVAEASVLSLRVPRGPFQRGCLAPQSKFLRGLPEHVARFYVASVILALEYLHDHSIVYRDLKPENVFIDQQGYPKLGDFGFAKVLDATRRTYTFCGTPGYVAPENVLAHGYGPSVDWWGLGVVTFVLLTGKQPFSSPKTDDPMVVMRRIVDEQFEIHFPPYVSPAARDLVLRLLERRPSRRLGVLADGSSGVKKHRWFDGFDWDALAARKMVPPRQPKDDAAKRIRDLVAQERKHPSRPPKDSAEELAEANRIFEDF